MSTGKKILIVTGLCFSVAAAILLYVILLPATNELTQVAGNHVESFNSTGYNMYHGVVNWWPLLAIIIIPAVGFLKIVQVLRAKQRGY